MTVEEILKAITTSSGGQLSAQDAKKFIETTKAQNEVLKMISTVEMESSSYNIHKIGVSSRQLQSPGQGVAPTTTSGATATKRTMTAKEAILPYDVTFDFLEGNITKEEADAALQKLFATQFGNDLLDLAVNGKESLAATITDSNTDGKDDTTGLTQADHTFLRLNDGWLTLFAADNTVNTASISSDVTSWRTELGKVLKAMPDKWKADPNKLCFFMNPGNYEDYCTELGLVATDAGINILLNAPQLKFKNIKIQPLPYLATKKIILTDPKNLYIGIMRQIRNGKFVNERQRQVEYTITTKVDFEYAVGEMIVLGQVS